MVSSGVLSVLERKNKPSNTKIYINMHASGVGKGSSNRNAKQKANHLALKIYLEDDLAHEAEQPPVIAPSSKDNDMYCWPWTGIVVNIVKEPDNLKDVKNNVYWMKRFSKYKPEEVEISWDDDEKNIPTAFVRFNNDMSGFENAMKFEKSFEVNHRSKREWVASDKSVKSSGSSIYGWLARLHDFESQGAIGEYLRKNRELKTISECVHEVAQTRNKLVVELASEIDMKNENLHNLQIKYNQKTMSLSRMVEDRDRLHQAFYDETRKMQRLSQENIKRVLDEQDKMNADLEIRKKQIDSRNRELNKREALTKLDKQKLEEEKKKNDMQNNSLQMASIEKDKADKSVRQLFEEQKREKEEALKELLKLEMQLDAKQKLEMEVEDLKGKLQVMKHLGDKDDDAVQEKIKEMNNELQTKIEEMDYMESLNQTLVVKERQNNDEVQEVRKALIEGFQDNTSGRTNIGVKRMGDMDIKAFHDACKERFEHEEAQIKASELCTLWQDKLKNQEWHPLKVIAVDGVHKEVVNEDDELLKNLKAKWGIGIFDAVVSAYMEMNEYNPSGRYIVNELWNYKDNRKATSKEAIRYILEKVKSLKRKR